MGETLAIMLTMTTYGTWLRGDARGWIDRGILMPPNPPLEQADRGPIWTDDYDKRYCFDEESVRQRIEYVERHNLAIGLSAKPWPFIETPEL